jgi:nicotinic acid mononucleotide adenylyltransferase
MATKTLPPRKTPPATDAEAIERYRVIERAIQQHEEFQADEMESAIGLYILGFHYGWKVLQLIHTRRTIAKYQMLMGIDIQKEFDEFGPDAKRTNAYKLIDAASNFWKLVSGAKKLPLDIDKRTVFSTEL